MRFSTLIALVGLTQAIRLNQQGGQGGNGQGPQRQRPSAEQIFDNCDTNDDDELTQNEVLTCLNAHFDAALERPNANATRIEARREQAQDGVRENFSSVASLNPEGNNNTVSIEELRAAMEAHQGNRNNQTLAQGPEGDNQERPTAAQIFDHCNGDDEQLTRQEADACVRNFFAQRAEQPNANATRIAAALARAEQQIENNFARVAGEDGTINLQEFEAEFDRVRAQRQQNQQASASLAQQNGSNNSGPAEQEERELPSAEEIFNHCERSDDEDELLTVGEAVACARQHVASQAAERVERRQNRVEEEIRENWPQDASGAAAALDLAAFENLYDQHVEEVEARIEERSNRRSERRAQRQE